MTTDLLGKAGPHPDLLDLLVEELRRIVVKGEPLQIGPSQVEVLQQRTFTGRPRPRAPEDETASISSCFTLLHDVPPNNTKGLAIFLAVQDGTSADWRVVIHQALSMPYPPPKPIEMLQIIDPLLGIGYGVHIYSPAVAALRAELADGSVLEDHVVNQSLHLLLPVHAPDGWPDEDAPVVRLLDTDGRDIIPPIHVRLQKRPPTSQFQDQRS